MVSAGYVGGTRGSGIESSAADVLWMSVVRGVRGVGGGVGGGVYEMCMCLARGGVAGEGGEWMRGLCFTNPVEQGECWTCFCCGGVGGVGGEWVGGLDLGLKGWGGVMSV